MDQDGIEEKSRILLSYYGDDFTGSTDCLEVLALNGLETVLFFQIPDTDVLQTEFKDVQCIGLAGVSRAMTPAEMKAQLPDVFLFLKQLHADIVHYKVCSTFDSSPTQGSIGLAIDIGREAFAEQGIVPLVVGAPALKRYTVFGNHFASVMETTYRLDRHPTMSRHPSTPMQEADIRLILGQQTQYPTSTMDIHSLDGNMTEVRTRFQKISASNPSSVMLFDVLDENRLTKTGQLIWESAQSGNHFVVGSSGVEYALTSYWNKAGHCIKRSEDDGSHPVSQILVLSGSCSPVTERQIAHALDAGFVGFKLSPSLLIGDTQKVVPRLHELMGKAVAALAEGKSVIFYSALGPEDSSIDQVKANAAALGLRDFNSVEAIGKQLGILARELIHQTHVQRLVVAGGDTSGIVARELHIDAVRMYLPIDPGGPLCYVHSSDKAVNGTQIALKGGQVGGEDYFLKVREGRSYTSSTHGAERR
ncbi:four-carbon acid sugar kinase family protein [Alicyclobacillus sp. SO9]|uniref:four-carbon acid sugar kinase family protein n=1 Tax=Alicyclobacillus sp. SO9 TaxID=2665646 RepID=UPI0018E85C15|nr:four-carbon acid sugar kinase family protein [Alicyclobacillus sp. SO9]QQE77950.1 four-carbon acid sugar kinase family protein [Alicyclobacillus sp. SO9]